MPWRLPAWVALILPLAVTENRFLQDDSVLSLGISLSFRCNKKPPWHALNRPGGLRTGGLIVRLPMKCNVRRFGRAYGRHGRKADGYREAAKRRFAKGQLE